MCTVGEGSGDGGGDRTILYVQNLHILRLGVMDTLAGEASDRCF